MKLNLLHTIIHKDFYDRIYVKKSFKFFLIYSKLRKIFYMLDANSQSNEVCKLKKI